MTDIAISQEGSNKGIDVAEILLERGEEGIEEEGVVSEAAVYLIMALLAGGASQSSELGLSIGPSSGIETGLATIGGMIEDIKELSFLLQENPPLALEKYNELVKETMQGQFGERLGLVGVDIIDFTNENGEVDTAALSTAIAESLPSDEADIRAFAFSLLEILEAEQTDVHTQITALESLGSTVQ